jgi:phage gp46-like protein
MQSLLPNVKEKARAEFTQALNEIAQDMNVVSVSVRAMLNLSEAMCKQIETSEDTLNLENLLREEMDALEDAQKRTVGEPE